MQSLRLRLFSPALRKCRLLSTTTTHAPYIPPASLEHVSSADPTENLPPVPTFYTARSEYYEQIAYVEEAIHHTRRALLDLNLMPLPKFAIASLPPTVSIWRSKENMAQTLQTKLSATRYRKLLAMLLELNRFKTIADTAGHRELGTRIGGVLSVFEPDDKEARLRRGKQRAVIKDKYGRTYTLGKRKTSSARVWMIANNEKPKDGSVAVSQILVNNIPLNQYFPVAADRERILRPFKIAGLLGAYNVFTLVRGGGTTGQSGAVAHGIAKGLAAHVEEIAPILRKAKLTRRDPRMVERKKTGMAKARKRYAWVKR